MNQAIFHQRCSRILSVLVLIVLLIQGNYTVAQPEVPYLSGRVNDYANLLSESSRQELTNLLQDHEDRTTNQVVVLTINSLEGGDINDFAIKTVEAWKLGQQGKDNGVLFVIAADDRKLRIEVGYGLEPYLTDADAGRIIRDTVVPYFRKGDFDTGIVAGTQAILNKIEGIEELSTSKDQSNGTQTTGYGILGVLLTIFSGIIGFFLWKKRRRNAPRNSKKTGLPMQKLKENEEKSYLDRGQQIEESIGSVDYDVWISSQPEDVLILPYKNQYLKKYAKCPQCGYITFYHKGSKVIMSANYRHDGQGVRNYACKNCDYTERREYNIPRLRRSHTVIVPGSGFGSGGGSMGGGFSGGGFSGGGGSFGGGGASGSW